MHWSDVVDLITVSHSNGETVVVTETPRTVYANKKSIVRSEYYQAIANGLNPTATFEIHSFEYEGEQKLRFEGQDFLILRTFSNNDETIELVCQAFDDVQTNVARLRDTVEIWHYVARENGMGEQSPIPELLFTVKGQVEFKGGGTGQVEDIIESTNNAAVTIVYRDGITPDMFLKIGGQRYEIRYIEDPFNRHQTLVLNIERVVP